MDADRTGEKSGRAEPAQSTYWKMFAVLAGVALVVTLLRPLDYLRAGADDHEAVGTKLPQLALEPLTGAGRSLTLGDLKDRVVLLNLWGPWCSYCLEEFPHLVELEQMHAADERFRLLAVSYPLEGNDLAALRRDTQAYLDRIDAEAPTYADPTHATHLAVAMTTGTRGFPTTVLLDGESTIRAVWIGYRTGDASEMDRLIRRLLAE